MGTANAGNIDGGGTDDKMNLRIHQGSFQINTDTGETVQHQDPNPQANPTYNRPASQWQPTTSKDPSSSRVMQSPGMQGQRHRVHTIRLHLITRQRLYPISGRRRCPITSHQPCPPRLLPTKLLLQHQHLRLITRPRQQHSALQQNQTRHGSAIASAHHQPTTAQSHHQPAMQHPPASLHRSEPPPTPPWVITAPMVLTH